MNERISVYINSKVLESTKKIAGKENRNLSNMVNVILKKYVEEYNKRRK